MKNLKTILALTALCMIGNASSMFRQVTPILQRSGQFARQNWKDIAAGVGGLAIGGTGSSAWNVHSLDSQQLYKDLQNIENQLLKKLNEARADETEAYLEVEPRYPSKGNMWSSMVSYLKNPDLYDPYYLERYKRKRRIRENIEDARTGAYDLMNELRGRPNFYRIKNRNLKMSDLHKIREQTKDELDQIYYSIRDHRSRPVFNKADKYDQKEILNQLEKEKLEKQVILDLTTELLEKPYMQGWRKHLWSLFGR